MPRLITARELDAQDRFVLCDLVRFGLLAADQIARRYADPALATRRIPFLLAGRVIYDWPYELDGARVYSPTALGAHLCEVEVDRILTNQRHLAHDVALVDLADYLLAHNPDFEWRTERELRRELDTVGPPRPYVPGDHRHRPDGLLLGQGQRTAVELEHSDKFDQRYTSISRWFATEYRLDRVRWYVDRPRIIRRLQQINDQHGFGRDIQVEIEPFPPGVAIRRMRTAPPVRADREADARQPRRAT
jgi:hypothetical protein